MKKSFYIIFSMISISVLKAQISTGINAGLEIYDSESRYSSTGTWEINAGYNYSEHSIIGVSLGFAKPELQIATPLQNLQSTISITAFTLTYTYLINSGIYKMRIGPRFAAGYKWLTREAYRISLGALGQRSIPAKTENFPVMDAGVQIRWPLSRLTHLNITSAMAYNTIDKGFWSLSVSGGLDVSIF